MGMVPFSSKLCMVRFAGSAIMGADPFCTMVQLRKDRPKFENISREGCFGSFISPFLEGYNFPVELQDLPS